MKRRFVSSSVAALSLLSVTLAGGALLNSSPANAAASGPFADVPADHWAYQAVDTLQKAGIVIGYPDGTYGGRRAMTRYEFAVAIARLLPMVQSQIDTSSFAKQSDLDALKTDVNNRLQQQQAALDAMKALVDEFQTELQRLGQDVAAIKARLDADEQRLAVVEAEQRRVKITGDVNFIVRGNVNTDTNKYPPLDKDGYRIGRVGNKSLYSTLNVYHDVLLNIDGRVSDSAHAIVKINASNYAPFVDSFTSLSPFRDENSTPSSTQFSLYRAYLDVPVELGVLSGAEAQIGRFGTQFTPYTLMGINPDSYASLPEANGEVTMDGAKVTASVGPAHVQVYAGKNSPVQNFTLVGGPDQHAANGFHRPGSYLQQGGQTYSYNVIDQSAGIRATFGTPDTFVVGVSGLLARTNNQFVLDPQKSVPYNNLAVYGADFNGVLPFAKSGITVDGEFAVSSTGQNSRFSNVNSTKGNEAYKVELGYTFGPLVVKGGYEDVYANFAAPGYWGKVGSWTNPTNIHGGIINATYAISPTISLVADGNFYKGQYNVGNQSPLGKDDKLNRFAVGLKYGLTSAYNVDLGYEYVQYDLKAKTFAPNDFINAGKPTETYITLGLGHSFNQNASVKLLYQIIDYKDKGTGFDPLGDSKGGVALTQFSLKF